MEKTIFFDLDGTIADLYGVSDWLTKLRAEDDSPYREAKPIFPPYDVYLLLESLKSFGMKTGVISWGSKHASKEYNRSIRRAKIDWLKEMGLRDSFDEIHVVKYGTPKHQVIKKERRGVLIDDDENVRKAWEQAGGLAINPMDENAMDAIEEIVKEWFD